MMNGTVMISLVGEQPIPNLLGVLHVKPEHTVLVHSERTEAVSERLRAVLQDYYQRCGLAPGGKTTGVSLEEVDPYNMAKIMEKLETNISQQQWHPDRIVFNVTGGTKPMAFAAYRLAERLKCPFLYLQSEGPNTIAYHYVFGEDSVAQLDKKSILEPLLDIDLYLVAHLEDKYQQKDRFENRFEEEVYETLKRAIGEKQLDEAKRGVKYGQKFEIDFVIRIGNSVGVAEAKTGSKARSKEGIGQLSVIAEQRFLGTYTKKFLILDREYSSELSALARAHHIRVIELLSAKDTGQISPEDRDKLIECLQQELGGRTA